MALENRLILVFIFRAIGKPNGLPQDLIFHAAEDDTDKEDLHEAAVWAITAIQRFGSALNLNPHFHSLVPDGVFIEAGQRVDFVKLPEPSDEDVAILVATIRRRVLRLLHRRGMLDEGCQDR